MLVKRGVNHGQDIAFSGANHKLREAEIHINQGISIAEASRNIGITEQTYYRWRKEYGGLRIEQAKKLKTYTEALRTKSS